MTDRDQRAERRAGRRENMEPEQEHDGEHQQYNTAESEGERAEDGNQAGSSRRQSSFFRNRSVSRGRNSIVNSFKLNLPVFKGRKES